ncbi:unnamed protein product [Paramecium pentaurelia]|uniref:Uncharacterized protein n=1 Tax=Paramecium pentaurelia TaxID=43138 RepID=A0A8S1WM19_9CILI|nr:unnamed protein product [Paramecium pentaurelia]
MQGLFLGGIYDNLGLRQGIWKDLDENFWDQAQIIQRGQYFNSKKIGRWKIINKNQIIGGGQYDDYRQKIGKWSELYRNFFSHSSSMCDIIHEGEYKDGKKIGYWIILAMNQEIGGGLYNDLGLKNGLWVEFSSGLQNSSQFIYKGNYLNGLKQGQWNTYFRDPFFYKKFELIGGGRYDNNGFKDGLWIDINESFHKYKDQVHIFFRLNQFTYNGEYKNNKQHGRWYIMYKKQRGQQFNQIGGGSFNQYGMKDGIWVEFADWYASESLVMFRGEYQNSQKFGRWDIRFKYGNFYDYQLIGGGTYDINGLKQGQWIDMNEHSYTLNSLITYNGEYKDNVKQGFWKTMFWSYLTMANFEQSGGGSFNQCGMKDGKWIELHPQFSLYTQIIHIGDYRNGQKCGKWDTCILETKSNKFEKIGGGWYDLDGVKYGIWVDLIDKATIFSSITFRGGYINGKKSGNWIIMHRDQNFNYIQIGGGSFDQNGFKNGIWIELGGDYYKYVRKIRDFQG